MSRFIKTAALTLLAATVLATGVAHVFGDGGPGAWLLEQEGGLAVVLMITLPLIVIGGVAGFVSYFEYHGIGCQDGIVRHGPSHDKEGRPLIALSFDDGPSPLYTPRILDILREKEVKATFFVTGRNVMKYPEVARRIANEGHDIGNHTYSHRDLVPSTRNVVLSEVSKTDAALQQVLGRSSSLFRPPRGLYSNAVRKLLVDHGYTIVLWTVSAVDWRTRPPRRIARRVLRYAKEGGIVLFHDSGAIVKKEGGSRLSTVKCLPLVIDMLRDAGFRIVPVSQMIAMSDEASYLTPVVEEV